MDDFLVNLQMPVLTVGVVGGGPDLRQSTPCQSITYQFGVWSRKEGGGGRFMVRLRQPTPRQLKAVLIDVLMPKGRGVQAQTSKIQTQTSQIQVQTSKIQFIVLFTNWLTMRDLEVLVPLKFMIFRCASFPAGPESYIY